MKGFAARNPSCEDRENTHYYVPNCAPRDQKTRCDGRRARIRTQVKQWSGDRTLLNQLAPLSIGASGSVEQGHLPAAGNGTLRLVALLSSGVTGRQELQNARD
jgi:hypothetical protein